MKDPRFAPLTLDFTFKRIFASESEQSNDFLISLIESFLGEYLQAKVKTVQLLPTERLNESREHRVAVFDLHCTDNNGNRFIVEMQFQKQDFFMGRILFYLGLTITGIVKKGKEYKFDLPRIFSLSFLDFDPELEDGNDEIVHHIGLTNLKYPERRHSDLHLAFVVLPKFKVALEECETTLDIWLWLFNNLHKLDEIPVRFRQGMFRGVFELAEISNFSKEELRTYEASMKEIAVYNATIAYAKKEGDKAGFGRGVKEGVKQGAAHARKELLALWESGVSLPEAKRQLGLS